MNRLLSRICAVVAIAFFSAPSLCGEALADNNKYQGGVTRSRVPEQTFLQRHPVVKRTAVGAAVGTAAGAGVGLISGRGGWRGAGIGAATGAGVGLIRSSKTLKRHPVASKVAQGSAVGLGVGLAASRGHGTGKRTAVAAGIGAAVGLGAGLLKNELQ